VESVSVEHVAMEAASRIDDPKVLPPPGQFVTVPPPQQWPRIPLVLPRIGGVNGDGEYL